MMMYYRNIVQFIRADALEEPAQIGTTVEGARGALAGFRPTPATCTGRHPAIVHAHVVEMHVGGIPETLRDGDNGLLAPPRDEQALARALARLLGDNALRDRLAQRARNHRTT